MKAYHTSLEGIIIIEPPIFKDNRGFFSETYHEKKYKEAGIGTTFVQDNHSNSKNGVLRGLHYQLRYPQGKLIYVLRGSIFDVAVDIRQGSPNFGKWIGFNLSEENKRQIYIPNGFAHGYYVLSKESDVIYKCTTFYNPEDEFGIRWDDPELEIDWPGQEPIISEKDSKYPFLSQIEKRHLPVWNGNN